MQNSIIIASVATNAGLATSTALELAATEFQAYAVGWSSIAAAVIALVALILREWRHGKNRDPKD